MDCGREDDGWTSVRPNGTPLCYTSRQDAESTDAAVRQLATARRTQNSIVVGIGSVIGTVIGTGR